MLTTAAKIRHQVNIYMKFQLILPIINILKNTGLVANFTINSSIHQLNDFYMSDKSFLNLSNFCKLIPKSGSCSIHLEILHKGIILIISVLI